MPGLNIPTLVKAGCLENDTINILNTAFNNTTSMVANNVATGQGFAVFNTAAAVTLLPATTPAGTYRVSAYFVITTTFVTNTTVNISFQWTDAQAAQSLIVATTSTLTAGTSASGTALINSNGTAAITFKPGDTGTAATAGVANWYVTVERLL